MQGVVHGSVFEDPPPGLKTGWAVDASVSAANGPPVEMLREFQETAGVRSS